jgi:photosystem II stability/assembly factor-like uncharacterized protein
MKKILTTVCLLSSGILAAQWTPLNSTTIAQLNDVDFLTENYGVIVGEGGTILHTTDGGATWADINHHNISGDVFNVLVKGTDTVYISTYDWNTATGVVYRTYNLGLSWTPIATDATTNHRVDLEQNMTGGHIFASNSSLLRTDDLGSTWDTLRTNIAGMLSTDLIKFADSQTGQLSGNQSGFIGYSAQFFRTEDGSHWYPGNSANFLNSDALTTMAFTDDDTAYIFMNQYAGFAPSAINRLVRITNFNLTIPSPGDTTYTFVSSMVNTAMPDYMNDAYFMNSNKGFAFGNAGIIYVTNDAGTTWTIDHNTGCSTCPILKSDFVNTTGYAVGSNGALIKYTQSTTGLSAISSDKLFNVFPNPATDKLTVNATNSDGQMIIVRDVKGRTLETRNVSSFPYEMNLGELPAGTYFLEIRNANGESSHARFIRM